MEIVDWRRLYGLHSGAEDSIEEFVDSHRRAEEAHSPLAGGQLPGTGEQPAEMARSRVRDIGKSSDEEHRHPGCMPGGGPPRRLRSLAPGSRASDLGRG
ncbi:hypothetical protein ABZ467_34500 [Streptomyces sp. NPDC005727]|uniref:hypothetical protein n=1 Tax=Streptomyces sp. NPDC005727 TaxID=3157053 RepID=UPI0033C63130